MRSAESWSSERFTLTVVPNRQEVAVVPEGELDLASVGVLEREVRGLYARGFGRVVVDLRRVGVVDSAGLRMLVQVREEAKQMGHTLTLVPGPSVVQRLFQITGTSALFEWRDY
jgi:anti-anti-sigma factor